MASLPCTFAAGTFEINAEPPDANQVTAASCAEETLANVNKIDHTPALLSIQSRLKSIAIATTRFHQ